MKKKSRLDAIKDIIVTYEIDKQEELTAKLNELGYKVSQATVSRDIKQLGLIKTEGALKKFKYAEYKGFKADSSEKIISLFKQVSISIVNANNLIIIKTLSGNAGTAGMAIDEMNFAEVLGTIAGDDTLLLVTRSNAEADTLVNILRNFLNAN